MTSSIKTLMEPNKVAEWAKVLIPILAAFGFVELRTDNVRKEVSEGVQKTRIADRAPAEFEMRDMNARIFILEAALNKHFAAIRRKHRPKSSEITLAEYALSPNQAQILRDDLRGAVRDVLKEIGDTPVIE